MYAWGRLLSRNERVFFFLGGGREGGREEGPVGKEVKGEREMA